MATTLTNHFSSTAVIRISAALTCLFLLTACSDDNASQPLSAEAQLLQTGDQKARMCVGCHGPQGISRVASYPSLAGKPHEYLRQQLHAFRSGTRENPMMSSIAKSMTEEDIAALSYYFASLPAPDSAPQNQVLESSQ